MKKFVYLCGMMLLSINIMAQIDPYDRNWKVVVFDDFDQPNRQFDSTFQEPDSLWTAFSHWLHPSGVTSNDTKEHQIYQWHRSKIDASLSALKLCAKYIQSTEITCSDTFTLPPPIFGKVYHCDPNKQHVYYHSGMIESYPIYEPSSSLKHTVGEEEDVSRSPWRGRFRYGFFEIRCKLPIHKGAWTAFWLWGAKDSTYYDPYYETIDIFERSWQFTDSTVYHNIHDTLGNPRRYLNRIHVNKDTYTEFPVVPSEEEDLSGWHTFSCLWMPDSVVFYRDGQVTAKERNIIPSHYLALKTSYAIDRYALHNHFFSGTPEWFGSDTLFVDYILVRQLQLDCDKDEVITCQNELDTFNYAIKKSISITSTINDVKVADTCKVTFRVTDAFQVTGPFQTDVGGELTVIIQDCPNELMDDRKNKQ